jgi:uncharacterized protein (UPF0548 family)
LPRRRRRRRAATTRVRVWNIAGHPERGEERFLVSLDEETNDVTALITAFSRPGSWATRAAGPIGRWIQHWMTQRYLEALRPK